MFKIWGLNNEEDEEIVIVGNEFGLATKYSS